ncbi:hypothetical protein QBC47DRAFT_431070 [Echria macrotheca]|uniref:Uncharacterized protein n=1 Tax=Echria macrotheca TaxID=438768 RepID=A0AAJ0BBK9_9PEZI|nr:hypothetical protein QBC47DRAFT_431070 [Echria macrotheca]
MAQQPTNTGPGSTADAVQHIIDREAAAEEILDLRAQFEKADSLVIKAMMLDREKFKAAATAFSKSLDSRDQGQQSLQGCQENIEINRRRLAESEARLNQATARLTPQDGEFLLELAGNYLESDEFVEHTLHSDLANINDVRVSRLKLEIDGAREDAHHYQMEMEKLAKANQAASLETRKSLESVQQQLQDKTTRLAEVEKRLQEAETIGRQKDVELQLLREQLQAANQAGKHRDNQLKEAQIALSSYPQGLRKQKANFNSLQLISTSLRAMDYFFVVNFSQVEYMLGRLESANGRIEDATTALDEVEGHAMFLRGQLQTAAIRLDETQSQLEQTEGRLEQAERQLEETCKQHEGTLERFVLDRNERMGALYERLSRCLGELCDFRMFPNQWRPFVEAMGPMRPSTMESVQSMPVSQEPQSAECLLCLAVYQVLAVLRKWNAPNFDVVQQTEIEAVNTRLQQFCESPLADYCLAQDEDKFESASMMRIDGGLVFIANPQDAHPQWGFYFVVDDNRRTVCALSTARVTVDEMLATVFIRPTADEEIRVRMRTRRDWQWWWDFQ